MSILFVETAQGRIRLEEGFARFGRNKDLEIPLVDPASLQPIPWMKGHVGTFICVDEVWTIKNEAPLTEPGRKLVLIRLADPPMPIHPQTVGPLSGAGLIEIDSRFLLRFDVRGGEAPQEAVP